MKYLICVCVTACIVFTSSGCLFGGGSSGGGNNNAPLSQIELMDPTSAMQDRFGDRVVVLPNGNIVIAEPGDDTMAMDAGVVHLYKPNSTTPISSIFGDNPDDLLGFVQFGFSNLGIFALPNNNYVIASPADDVNGIDDAGSVRLVNGSTGMQIGTPIIGNDANDQFGLMSVTALGNNNYVVASASGAEGDLTNEGSVRLVNGNTGMQIGMPIVVDVVFERFNFQIIALSNNNYVIASPFDDVNGIEGVGSARLVDGTTGMQIGTPIVGDVAGDSFRFQVTPLANNNYVIASPFDVENGIQGGSVRLVDGNTGLQIGTPIVGNEPVRFDGLLVTALANNNYAIATPRENAGGVSSAGSVRLVDGNTGMQIGAPIVGDMINDSLGSQGITALSNSNYVVVSQEDNVGNISAAGSVRLVDGNTGVQIGAPIVGDVLGDFIGSSGVTALANSNYVINSEFDDENGIVDAGSVRLIDGSTGLQIGTPIVGNSEGVSIGFQIVISLANSNYVIAVPSDNSGSITGTGTVRLMDGNTGMEIGKPIVGDMMSDVLGAGGLFALPNNDYVIISERDDEGGIMDAGSVRMVNGTNGTEISNFIGATTNDIRSATVIPSDTFYILSLPDYDNNGLVDSGRIELFPY